MWTSSEDKYTEAWSYKGHSDEVLALSMHPSGKISIELCSTGEFLLS